MIKIIRIAALAAFATSMALPGQDITVTSPTAADDWCIGTTYSITWTKSGDMPNKVTIRLRRAGSPNSESAVSIIAAETDNNGTFRWPIPNSVAAGEYFIRIKTVSSVAGAIEVSDDSPSFTTMPCPSGTASITVNQPNASTSWRPGSRQTITWTKSGALNPMVNITLRREGAPESEAAVARIADGCANNGSRVWFIPDSLAEGRYFVRIRAGGVQDDSAAFSISAAGERSAPDGPDTWIRCDLEIPGVGVEYVDGNIVAWVRNNGPDNLRDHNVQFILDFRDDSDRSGGHYFTKRITVPPGQEKSVQIIALEASVIPAAGLRTSVSIDTSRSHIRDSNPRNQHREVRLYSDSRPPFDLGIDLDNQRVTRGPWTGHGTNIIYRLRGTMRLHNNSDNPAEWRRAVCKWQLQSRDDEHSPWLGGYPYDEGVLQLGPFRRGEVIPQDIMVEVTIPSGQRHYEFRIAFELDAGHILNDPDRSNNEVISIQWSD